MLRSTRFMTILPALATLGLSAGAHAATTSAQTQSVVLAGGCFWGMEDVFEHVKGVTAVKAGYAGGKAETAHYEMVSGGDTGHAEAVQVTYDPSQVTFAQLLDVYFKVAHDPTEMNRQGPDSGTQYRSEIFYTTPEQQTEAKKMIAALDAAKAFPKPVVTKLEALPAFYPAEDYHQNYAALNPYNPYIIINDAPKVRDLKKQYEDLYVDEKK